MGLKDRIRQDLNQALRDKDSARTSALRLLVAAIQRREIDERTTLDDAQVLATIEKLIKQSREAIEQYRKGNRPDLVEKESADVAAWQAYLPQPLTAAEVDGLIDAALRETAATSIKDMGKLMAVLKPRLQGRADLGQVSAKVKAKLGG